MSLEDLASKYSNRSTLSDDGQTEYIPSGSVMLDAVLSDGKGVPKGSWVQITSPSGCGKTHLVLTMAKSLCSRGKKVVYIDDEKGVNESQMKGIGIDKYLNKSFFLYQISTFEEAEEIMDEVVEDSEVAMVAIDSITGLIPEKIVENSISSIEPGLQARYASTFLVKYRTKISRSENKPFVFLINQQRTKMNFKGTTTTGEAGGNAQQYYTDIRLQMKKDKALTKTVNTMEGKKSIEYGVNASLWAVKNRHAAPFVVGIITVIYGKGISNLAAYQRALMSEKVLKMSGAGFWSLKLPDKEEQKARGSEGVLNLIKDNLADIKQFIEEVGGFTLVKGSEDE